VAYGTASDKQLRCTCAVRAHSRDRSATAATVLCWLPAKPTHCVADIGACNLQVAEQTTQYFITNDRPNVAGLVLAGSADFKTELAGSDMFDQRLKAIVLLTVDVSYGAPSGSSRSLFCGSGPISESVWGSPSACT